MVFRMFASTNYALLYRKSFQVLTLGHKVWMIMKSNLGLDICYTLSVRLCWEYVLLNLTAWPRRSMVYILIARICCGGLWTYASGISVSQTYPRPICSQLPQYTIPAYPTASFASDKAQKSLPVYRQTLTLEYNQQPSRLTINAIGFLSPSPSPAGGLASLPYYLICCSASNLHSYTILPFLFSSSLPSIHLLCNNFPLLLHLAQSKRSSISYEAWQWSRSSTLEGSRIMPISSRLSLSTMQVLSRKLHMIGGIWTEIRSTPYSKTSQRKSLHAPRAKRDSTENLSTS